MTATRTPDVIVVGAGSAGAILAARLTEDPSWRVLRPFLDARPRQLADAIVEQVNPCHPVGARRMGSIDDPMAGVDDTGHLHAVSGLAVVDASIFPNVPSADTNVADHDGGRTPRDGIRLIRVLDTETNTRATVEMTSELPDFSGTCHRRRRYQATTPDS